MLELLLGSGKTRKGKIPGPKELVHGDSTLGYYGQVPDSEFVSGVKLAEMVKLIGGTDILTSKTWLKFSHNDRILFVAKQPFRHSIQPNPWLLNPPLIFGNTTVSILDRTYKVRLLTGGATTPGTGSEWNDLMYRVSANDPTGTFWERFTNAEITVGAGNGRLTWALETTGGNRVQRGGTSISDWVTSSQGSAATGTGWRPVLELIPD